ncbi:MAG TPA: CPBP family intramembrane glutamic endopeptidase [Gemmataceae bacterium]|nr:CPBP family intramembrane glutamic endopeptidase [Gemmataceae bacterium]
MSTDRPDDFDDVPTLRPLPLGGSGDDQLRDDYRDDRPPPPRRKPGFGFWRGALWAWVYFVATQVIGAIVLGIPIIGVALIVDAQQNGKGAPNDPAGLNEWMLGPTGRVATLTLVVATQFLGLLLSWILLRYWCGREWKRKIALTRLPTWTHCVLVVIGFPALIALGAAIEGPIQQYVPSLQDVLNSLGLNIEFEGADKSLPKLIGPSPWALAIFAVAISPAICEEVFCRGFLAWGLSGRYVTWAVVLIVSFLFGCLHGDPQQGVGAMFLGAAIHGAYVATRSLWVAMFVHFANNGIAVVHFNQQLSPGVLDPFEQALKNSPVLFIAAGLLLFVAVSCALYQTRCKLVSIEPGLPPWQPDGVSSQELPPPGSGTIVAHDPISPMSVALVLTGAVAFGLVMAFA